MQTTHDLSVKPGLRERMVILAEKKKRSVDVLEQEALHQYLDREEARLAMQEDAKAALDDYRANGLHLTGEEVDRWLADLERGDDLDPPACHG